MAARIALVDDDAALRGMIGDYLATAGFQIDTYESVRAFRAAAERGLPDVVISDLRMPDEDGLALLAWLRSFAQTPVIMLTSVDETTDRVVGLELGADDYVAKPCDLRELMARVRAQLRRLRSAAAPVAPAAAPVPGVWFGRWRLDRSRRRLVDHDGQECPITGADYALLEVFADHPGVVLSRDKLLELAGIDADEAFDRAIDMRVARLRKKIEPVPGDPTVIRTVRGHGGGYEYVPGDGPGYGR